MYAKQTIVPTSGKIQDVDAPGIIITLPSGQTYIPYIAILRIVGPTDV